MKEQKTIITSRKKSRISSRMIMILLLLFGLFLLLYPAIADYINSLANKKAIGEYQKQVQALSQTDYTEMLNAAREYNERLFKNTPFIGELTQEKREEYESLLDITGTGIMGYVEIEKVNIYLAIYHGTSNEVLQTAAGHLEGSSLPVDGKSVHAVISGHCGLPSARLFTDVDQLEVGDTFSVHVLNETMTYEVEKIEKVLPETLKSLQIEEGKEQCTLMTCTPYSVNSHRLLVTGHRIETPGSEVQDNRQKETVPEAYGWDAGQLIVPAVILAAVILTSIMTTWLINKKRKH